MVLETEESKRVLPNRWRSLCGPHLGLTFTCRSTQTMVFSDFPQEDEFVDFTQQVVFTVDFS